LREERASIIKHLEGDFLGKRLWVARIQPSPKMATILVDYQGSLVEVLSESPPLKALSHSVGQNVPGAIKYG
jgi:hypothetical protein